MGPLNMYVAVDFGKTRDLTNTRSARLTEYFGQLSLRLAPWLSLGGNVNYRNQAKGFTGDRFDHLTAADAATLAAKAGVRKLILNHISRRYSGSEILAEAQRIFPPTVVATDLDQFRVTREGVFRQELSRAQAPPPEGEEAAQGEERYPGEE